MTCNVELWNAALETFLETVVRAFVFQEVKHHKLCINKDINTLRLRAYMDQSNLTCETVHLQIPCHASEESMKQNILSDFVFMIPDLIWVNDDWLLNVKCHVYSKYHKSILRARIDLHIPHLISMKLETRYQLVRRKKASLFVKRKHIVMEMLSCPHAYDFWESDKKTNSVQCDQFSE